MSSFNDIMNAPEKDPARQRTYIGFSVIGEGLSLVCTDYDEPGTITVTSMGNVFSTEFRADSSRLFDPCGCEIRVKLDKPFDEESRVSDAGTARDFVALVEQTIDLTKATVKTISFNGSPLVEAHNKKDGAASTVE